MFKWAAWIFPCGCPFNQSISQEYSPFFKQIVPIVDLSFLRQANRFYNCQQIVPMASNPIFSSIDTFLVFVYLLVNLLYRLCKLHFFQNNEKVKTVVKTFKNIPKRTIEKREDHLRFRKFFRTPHQSNYSITKWSLCVI